VTLLSGQLHQTQEVRSGASYLSQNDLKLHFGLGSATKVDQIEVHWPSGIIDKSENVSADRFLSIEEGQGAVPEKPTETPKALRPAVSDP
jgi:hypothetical protein